MTVLHQVEHIQSMCVGKLTWVWFFLKQQISKINLGHLKHHFRQRRVIDRDYREQRAVVQLSS